jgi:formamidopyrimidine-DNA glycosylase
VPTSDVVVYVEALERRILGARLGRVRLVSPFVLRSVTPAPAELEGRCVTEVRRIGKRIAIGLEGELFIVIHLMIAGRLHWADEGRKPPGRKPLVAFEWSTGTLALTEAGSKRRASLHLVRGRDALALHDPGGVEPLDTDLEAFAAVLRSANHTLKRALTDPRLLSGIGNAYSDEILHRAGRRRSR